MSESTTTDPYFISYNLFNVLAVEHTGCCGYICLAELLGFPNWIGIARRFKAKLDCPFFTSECRARILRVNNLIDTAENEGEELTSLDTDCYLTTAMIHGFAMAMNVHILVFKEEEIPERGYVACFPGGGQINDPLAVHCLLYHGVFGDKFDALCVADASKAEEMNAKLLSMCCSLFNRSVERSETLGFADIDDEGICAKSTTVEVEDDDNVDKLAAQKAKRLTVPDDSSESDESDDDDDEDAVDMNPSKYEVKMQFYEARVKREAEEMRRLEAEEMRKAQEQAGGTPSSGRAADASNQTTPSISSGFFSGPTNATTVKPLRLDGVVEDDKDESQQLLETQLSQCSHEDLLSDLQDRVQYEDLGQLQDGAILVMDSAGRAHVSHDDADRDLIVSGDNSNEEHGVNVTGSSSSVNEELLREACNIIELEVGGCEVQTFTIGGNERHFEVLPRRPHKRKGQRVRCVCENTKKFGEVHRYTPLSILQNHTKNHASFCGMRLKTDLEDIAYCIVLMETACEKLHRLIHHKGVTFLCDGDGVHSSYRTVNPDVEFRIRQYVYDPSIPVNIDELYQLGHTYLSEHGSKGIAGDGVHNWFVVNQDDDEEEDEEGDEEDDPDGREERGDGDDEEEEGNGDDNGTTAKSPQQVPTAEHNSYLLQYVEPCDVRHSTSSKALFFNQVAGKIRHGRPVKKTLIGLMMGSDIVLKRYSLYSSNIRFVCAGFLIVLKKGAKHKSIKRSVYPLMYDSMKKKLRSKNFSDITKVPGTMCSDEVFEEICLCVRQFLFTLEKSKFTVPAYLNTEFPVITVTAPATKTLSSSTTSANESTAVDPTADDAIMPQQEGSSKSRNAKKKVVVPKSKKPVEKTNKTPIRAAKRAVTFENDESEEEEEFDEESDAEEEPFILEESGDEEDDNDAAAAAAADPPKKRRSTVATIRDEPSPKKPKPDRVKKAVPKKATPKKAAPKAAKKVEDDSESEEEETEAVRSNKRKSSNKKNKSKKSKKCKKRRKEIESSSEEDSSSSEEDSSSSEDDSSSKKKKKSKKDKFLLLLEHARALDEIDRMKKEKDERRLKKLAKRYGCL